MKSSYSARLARIIGAGALLATSAALAQSAPDAEYEYDDLGRLKSVTYSNNKDMGYYYDPAGNREAVVIADEGALPAEAPEGGVVIVVPLNGFTVVPVQ